MRNFVGFVTDKTIWSFLLLLIAIWSAFSFYWSGYDQGKKVNEETIINQQQTISALRQELAYLKSYPSYRVRTPSVLVLSE